MPTTQPATDTPCPQKGKAPRRALAIKAPKEKKNKKPKSGADIKTVKRSLEDALNEADFEKK